MASGEMSSAEFTDFLRKAMIAARDHSAAGSLAYYFMDWRHMTEILSAGQEVYTELLNLCVWAKSNGGMGSFYRSAHGASAQIVNYGDYHRLGSECRYKRFRQSETLGYPIPSESSSETRRSRTDLIWT